MSSPESSFKSQSDEKAEQELINLRLMEEKLRTELLDLRRPYLLRNPQLLTAIIASIGATIGIYLLISEDLFKIRDANNTSLQLEAKHLQEESITDKKTAAAVKRTADDLVRYSHARITKANDLAATAVAKARELRENVESEVLSLKAEQLLASNQLNAARVSAISAWKVKQTDDSKRAVVDVFSHPITEFDDCRAAVFAPIDSRVLTVCDGGATLWNSETGSKISEFKDDRIPVMNLAVFSPDGKSLLITGTTDRNHGPNNSPDIVHSTAAIWKLNGKTPESLLKGHVRPIFDARWSADGLSIITASYDHSVRVWDAFTGAQQKEIDAHVIALAAHGRRFVVQEEPVLWIWDTASGGRAAELKGAGNLITQADFSPNGRLLVTADMDGIGRLWDGFSGRLLDEQKVGYDIYEGLSVTFSPDGGRIAGVLGGEGFVWDTNKRKVMPFPLFEFVAFSPDGSRIMTGSNSMATILDAATGVLLTTLVGFDQHILELSGPTSASFSLDGKRAIITQHSGNVRIYHIVCPTDIGSIFASVK